MLFELSQKYGAKKEIAYCARYDELFTPIRKEVRAILELGTNEGGSLQMWNEFFPKAQVFGVDFQRMWTEPPNGRIHTMIGDQKDVAAIGAMLAANGVDTLDIVIDDCSHFGYETKVSFWALFDKYLRSGGYYIIEDWGTGYWADWPDGKLIGELDTSREKDGYFASHPYGMPGFLKQLLDETHRGAHRGVPDPRHSKFQWMELREAICVVKKV